MLTEAEQRAVDAVFATEEEVEPQEEVVEEEPEPTSEEPAEEEEQEVEPEPQKEAATVPLKAVQEERRKRQELEERLKVLESEREAEKAKAPPKDIFEAFDKDSDGVLRDLNTEIKRLVDDDPYGNAVRIEQLRDLKGDLRQREVAKISNQLAQQTEAQKVLAEVQNTCPDLGKLVSPTDDAPFGLLTKFAVDRLGYTQEDLDELTPQRGMSAARKVKALYNAYKLAHPEPEKKEARPRPTPVETAGRGIPKQEPDHEALKQKAMRSGKNDDWAEYFIARGLV